MVVQIFDTNRKYGLAESDTIARYFMSQYIKQGPSFQPLNPLSNLLARFHDMYLTTIQGCLYKPAPPFGMFATRQDALREFQRQLEIIERLMVDDGLYLCGPEISYADAAIFPTLVFAHYMMPKFVGSCPSLTDEDFPGKLPPKLAKYYSDVQQYDPVFARIRDEVCLTSNACNSCIFVWCGVGGEECLSLALLLTFELEFWVTGWRGCGRWDFMGDSAVCFPDEVGSW